MFGSGVLKDGILKPWIWLALAIAAGIISWSYTHRVLRPWESYVDVTRGHLKAQMGDLYPRWVGARELLLNGHSPYGKEVSEEIQVGFYGHPLEQNYDKPGSEILDEQRFAYPVYVVFLLAPTVHMDFSELQDWAAILFAALTALSVWLWMAVLRYRPPFWLLMCTVLFVLATPQVMQGLRLRQFSLLVAFLIALAAWFVSRERYFFGGMLLAIATIKPQMALLCIAWFLLWSFGDWKRRGSLVGGFGVTLCILIGAGLYVLPGWPREFLEGIEAYRRYYPTTSPLRLALGDWIGGAFSILLVIALFARAWRNRTVLPQSRVFAETLSLFLVASSLVLPLLTPFNQVLLLLPALMLLRDWRKVPRIGHAAFGALMAWPWIASLVLLVHPPRIQSLSRLPLLPSLLVLVFPFVIAGLLFIRLRRAH